MRRMIIAVFGACLGLTLVAIPPADADPPGALNVTAGLAPVAPDGLTAGAVTDFIVGLADIDPDVDGIGLKAGGSIRITLPDEFVNEGVLPVVGNGAIPGCGPPAITTCSTAVILQGWPQSPRLPFPDVSWEPASNTVVISATADWLPAGPAAPGPKTVHLQLFGFTNPERPGNYSIDVSVQPDPNTDHILFGRGKVRIDRNVKANVSSLSLANGGPPPPFPNTLFQTVSPGDPSLTMMLYLWAADREPLVGASFEDGAARVRLITDSAGRPVGRVKVSPPSGAEDWSLTSSGPAVEAPAFLTGYETATLRAVLETDAQSTGTYAVQFHLFGGNSITHHITAE
jgi:hypothetical protein